MKKTILAMMGILCFAGHVHAGEALALSADPSMLRSYCSTPIWHGEKMVWKGVTDKRADKSIGDQTNKKGESTLVEANPPLEKVFDGALTMLLEACGLKLSRTPSPDIPALAVEISDFHADVLKKLLTGAGKASSHLTFITSLNDSPTQTIEVGFETTTKSAKKRSLRQLEQTINDLFLGTLEQIPKTKQVRDLLTPAVPTTPTPTPAN